MQPEGGNEQGREKKRSGEQQDRYKKEFLGNKDSGCDQDCQRTQIQKSRKFVIWQPGIHGGKFRIQQATKDRSRHRRPLANHGVAKWVATQGLPTK